MVVVGLTSEAFFDNSLFALLNSNAKAEFSSFNLVLVCSNSCLVDSREAFNLSISACAFLRSC